MASRDTTGQKQGFDSTVADLDDLVRASAAVKRPYEGPTFLNLSFYAGQQWTAWDGNKVYEPAVEDYREKVVDNRIQPFVRTEIAKMTKTQPVWTGVPKTQSDEDVGAARYAEMAMEDAWKKHNMQRKLRAALLWSRLSGAGFWKITWDNTVGQGRDILIYGPEHPQAGFAVKDPNGAPVHPSVLDQLPPDAVQSMVPKTIYQGDLSLELRTFFEVFPDPHCGEEGLESAEWIAEESVYTRQHMSNHFPEVAEGLTYNVSPIAGIVASRSPMGAVTGASTVDMAKGVKVREMWTPQHHVVWIEGGQILTTEANPYPWLPYVMFTGTPVPGQFWPDCVVSQMRPRQVDLNKRLSQIAENADRLGNPGLLVPSTMSEDFEWHGLPGERVEYQDNGSPGSIPSFLQWPGLSNDIYQDVDRAEKSLMEISGQHEVSQAQVPAGVTAASALALLQEQDDTKLGPDVSDMENVLSEAGQKVLHLIRTYYTDERHLSVSGQDSRWDVLAFKGDMTEGCDTIEIQTGSMQPQSKAAKVAVIQQMMTNLLQSGQQISKRDLGRLFSQMEVGGSSQFFATAARDERQVEDENRRLANAEIFDINSYDDDDAHIDFHTDFFKSSKWQAVCAAIPQASQVGELHLQQHYTRKNQMLLNQMQGGPPVNPGDPPPPAGAVAPSGPPAGPMPPSGSAATP